MFHYFILIMVYEVCKYSDEVDMDGSEVFMRFYKIYMRFMLKYNLRKTIDSTGDHYDDRIENSWSPVAGNKVRKVGDDWAPGQVVGHKSLISFQK